MSVSTGLEKLREVSKKETIALSGDEQASWGFIRDRIALAKRQRELRYPEFNDLTYLDDYNANQQISHSYIRARLNDSEVRINTGTVEKKLGTVMNELLALNMGVEVHAFDEDDQEIQELGDDMADIIKRTNEWERDEDLKPMMLIHLLAQRALFIEECWEEKIVTDKRRESYNRGRVHQTKFSAAKRKIQRPRKRLVDGLKVYLGDITIPSYRFDDQPYIVVYDVMSYKKAEGIFGDFERWKYVKPGMPVNDWYDGRYNWRFSNLAGVNEVEVVRYMSFPDDEYQIAVNGVPMFAPGEPLPYEQDGYNLKMFTYRDMVDNFAYGQTFMINARPLGLIKDEMLRSIIRKFRQAVEPPIGVRGRRVLSRDIWQEGAVTQNVGKDDFERLIDHDGVNPSEFQMIEFMAGQIQEEMGVSALMQGTEGKKLTATQASEQMRQAIKSLGLAVLAWTRVIRECSYMRLYNVLEHSNEPTNQLVQDGKIKKVYQAFTIKGGNIGNDQSGKKIVQFMDRDLTHEEKEQIYDFEEAQAAVGEKVRIKAINVDRLRELPTHWYIVVTPKEQETSALQKAMFTEKLGQATGIAQMTGRQVNADKVIDDFERTWKVRGMFQEAPSAAGVGSMEEMAQALGKPAPGPSGGAGGRSEISAQMQQGVRAQTRKPGVNQIMNAPAEGVTVDNEV